MRVQPIGAVVERRTLEDFQIRMQREDLIVNAADPMGARANLAIGQGLEVGGERSPEFRENLGRRVIGHAAHQQQIRAHCILHLLERGPLRIS